MKPFPYTLPAKTVIGAWKIHDLLGSGGQGAVWSARPAKTKHAPPRALKACFATEQQARSRFTREAELLLSCDFPHVLKIIDQDLVWKEHVPGLPEFAYYVSEKYLGSLTGLQQDLGDARRRVDLFRQMCRAITYLHTLPDPIIHRDLKPENFLLATELRKLVLADFGIARALSSGPLTEAFEVMGTQCYRAPEVSNGQPGSERSDIYSLGRVLEWLLTGEVSTDMGVRPVPRGLELDDDACDRFDRIITKATQASVQSRFETVRQMEEQVPELWLSTRPHARVSTPFASTAPSDVLQASLEFAKTNDTLSRRRLEGELRRQMQAGMIRWAAENANARIETHAEAGRRLDDLLDLVMARMLFAIAPAYVDRDSSPEISRMIDDCAQADGWPAHCASWVRQAPRALLYLLHYLHGALCLSFQQVDAGLRVAELPVPNTRSDDVAPLWQHSDVVGYPETFAEDSGIAWSYLLNLRSRHPSLEALFPLQTDFEAGLAAYSICLTLFELAREALQSQPRDLTSGYSRLSIPPMFVRISHETIATAARHTSGSRAVVGLIAARVGADVRTMHSLWPTWKALISKYRSRDRAWWGELPLGDLAM